MGMATLFLILALETPITVLVFDDPLKMILLSKMSSLVFLIFIVCIIK